MNTGRTARTHDRPRHFLATVMTAAALTIPACSGTKEPTPPSPPIGGNYGPVTRDHLIGERVWWCGGPSDERFVGAFSQDGFVIKGEGGPVPRDVLDAILGKGREARLIEGKWELTRSALILSGIRADDVDGFADVRLKVFLTGPSLVRMSFGGRQYVLGPTQG
jgi:hypothetical protein